MVNLSGESVPTLRRNYRGSHRTGIISRRFFHLVTVVGLIFTNRAMVLIGMFTFNKSMTLRIFIGSLRKP